MLDLNDLQVFERVAALHGFSEAARALGLPKSNISRSVARLEGALGARLFHRSTRDVTLTSAGIALRDRARDIIERAGEALDYVGSLAHGPRGSIKVNSGIGFGLNVLGYELPTFLRRYPDVDVTLDLESRSADLVDEAIDVAVRLGPLPDSSLIAVRLGAMRRYLCAGRSYVERCGTPNSIDALKDHDIIEMPGSDGRPRPWVFTREGKQSRVALHPRVTVNEALTIHRLVLSGAGLGIVSGVHLHRGPTLSRQIAPADLRAHHHRRLGAGCAGGHLREEAHALAERPRLDLEEGASAARLPVLEGILLDLVDDGAAGLTSRRRNVLRPVAGDLEGEAVPHGLPEFHQLAVAGRAVGSHLYLGTLSGYDAAWLGLHFRRARALPVADIAPGA